MAETELSGLVEFELDLLKRCFRGFKTSKAEAARLAEEGTKYLAALKRHKIDSLLYVGCLLDSPIQRVYDKVWMRQREALLHLLNQLLDKGISPIIFKGAEFLAASYHPHALGLNNDVDILVERPELGTVKKVLHSMDYSQSLFDPNVGELVDRDLQDIAEFERAGYELIPFNRKEEIELEADELAFAQTWQSHPLWVVDDRCFVITTFDPHYGVSYDVPGDEFFSRAVPSAVGAGRAMSLADQLWFTTSRYYNEVALNGKDSLRDFAYIASLIPNDQIDWDVILGAADRYDLRPSLYYYFAFLNRLGGAIPDEALEELSPGKGSRDRDWGWQLSKLFDLIDPYPLAV